MLKLLGNEYRLLILCSLIAQSEMKVGDLVDAVGLSQSALSQHLALLREEGLVTFRRESQTLHYRVSDPRAARILKLLKDMFCGDLA
jgi:DNA-binding transcriptional ArsR family regulator